MSNVFKMVLNYSYPICQGMLYFLKIWGQFNSVQTNTRNAQRLRAFFAGYNCHAASSLKILIDNTWNRVMIVPVLICFRLDKKTHSNKIKPWNHLKMIFFFKKR